MPSHMHTHTHTQAGENIDPRERERLITEFYRATGPAKVRGCRWKAHGGVAQQFLLVTD